MTCCPTCKRALPEPTAPRIRKCWSCGVEFTQTTGRRRIVCHDPRCEKRRKTYRNQGFAALDRMP